MMDQIDREIINMLQKNARIPLKAIAQEVHLSIPAVFSEGRAIRAGECYLWVYNDRRSGEDGIPYYCIYQYGVKTGTKGWILQIYPGGSECGRVQSYYRSLLDVDQSTVPKYHGIRSVCWNASEIWKDTDTDRIFFDCKCKEYRSA